MTIIQGNPAGPSIIRADDIMGFQEVTTYLGVSKQRVSVLRKRSEFPEPICTLASTPIWDARLISMYKLHRDLKKQEMN